jgi:integrase
MWLIGDAGQHVAQIRMRCYTVQEVKRILGNTKGTERIFYWLAAETGLRAGELIALRASEVDVERPSIEVSKAIWGRMEHNPKTEAGFRSICISARLGAAIREYLASRADGIYSNLIPAIRGTPAACLGN